MFHREAYLVQHPHAITCKPIQNLANKGRKQQEFLQGNWQSKDRIFTDAVVIVKKTKQSEGLTVGVLVSLPQLYLFHMNSKLFGRTLSLVLHSTYTNREPSIFATSLILKYSNIYVSITVCLSNCFTNRPQDPAAASCTQITFSWFNFAWALSHSRATLRLH